MNAGRDGRAAGLPAWVPGEARAYLAHVEAGAPIRRIARAEGRAASTVLRRIRRLEARRDDPLVDEALATLGATGAARPEQETTMTPRHPHAVDAESRRALRALAEPDAVLALAEGLDRAVIVRETPGGATRRTVVLDRTVARAMALRNWIACAAPGARVARYAITPAGRAALRRHAAEAPGGSGLAEAPARFDHARGGGAAPAPGAAEPGAPPSRNLAESPIAMLARRRDRDGRFFLTPELVAAGERLREEFELARMAPRVTQDWDRFLAAGVTGGVPRGPGEGPARARARVQAALAELGPGLADVALRTCCFLEGIESFERRAGWSPRSGKVVLRIALQRLRRHYDSLGDAGRMVG